MSIPIYPIPDSTISGTVNTEDIEAKSSLERLVNQMSILLKQQSIITEINLEEE